MTHQRTVPIIILAAVALIAALLNVVDVLRYLGLLPVAVFGPINFFDVSILGAILAGIVALIWFGVARQLWNLDPRGWSFVVIIAVMNLIFLALAVLGRSTFQSVLLSVVVNVVALGLVLLPSTKAAFGQRA